MTAQDVNTENGAKAAAGGRRASDFWIFAVFALLVIVGAAIPFARTGLLFVLTLPLRLLGLVLPGSDLYTDAVWAAHIMGWAGWAALAFVLAPLLVIVVGWALKLAPRLHTDGAVWSEVVRGGRGRNLAIAAWAGSAAPILAIVIGVALGLLLPWTLGVAMLISAALLAPLVGRSEEHPLIGLVRHGANLIDALCRIVGESARWASLALVIVVAVAVTQRYVFGITFTKLDELMVYLHAALFMLVAASTLKTDGHVRVDVFYGSASPMRRAMINFIGVYVLLAPMCLVILDRSGRYVDLAWRVGEGSTEGDGLPLVFLLKTVIPTFAVLLLAQGAALAAREAFVLVGADEPSEQDAEPRHEPI